MATTYHALLTPPPTPNRTLIKRLLTSPRQSTTEFYPRYPPSDPNLELHSAAASGNVGLVHYALTHGQPVNSVLHGVLPLHAACSGGNVSVVRMLIERGADVNAPRLPRRYSEGKKSTAPSVGAAGSTPLHFAAANGHAPIVQILLTCGATPNKPDKNGMTPEALAEVNGHTDVIRVLRVWEHLQGYEPNSAGSSYPSSDRAEPSSPSGSASQIDENERTGLGYGILGSLKGKERAWSFASNVSDKTNDQAVRVKKSLEGFLKGRSSRSGSIVSSHRPDDLAITPRMSGADSDTASIADYHSAIDLSSPTSPTPLAETEAPLDRVASGASASSSTVVSPARPDIEEEVIPDLPDSPKPVDLGPAPSRHNPSTTGSSRRPSLPSILEKAVHPGAAFRAALRRDPTHSRKVNSALKVDPQPPTQDEKAPGGVSPQAPAQHQHHRFFRSRHKSNEESASRGRPKQVHQNKHMTKHALLHLFRRGHSPPSRSPSPPRKTEATKPIAPEELDEGIARLRRASLELDMRERGSQELDETEIAKLMPVSAPATKTAFYPEELSRRPSSTFTVDPASIPLPPPSPSGSTRAPALPRTRSRQASDVIAPSPLANEWAHSSDSDTPPSYGIRRAKTEVLKSTSSSPRPSYHVYQSSPSSPLRHPSLPTKRSVTMPSSPVGSVRTAGGIKSGIHSWRDPSDLRKVASGVFKRESPTMEQYPVFPRRVTGGSYAEQEDDYFSADDHEEVSHEPEEIDQPEEVDQSDDVTPRESEDDGDGMPADGSDETEREDGDSTPEAVAEHDQEVFAIDKPTSPTSPQTARVQGRFRGASVGSMSATTESSRISTPPGSSLRMSLITSDEDHRSPQYRSKGSDGHPPAPPPSVVDTSDGRARGKSVSSMSSTASGMAFSYMQASTPGTSLTPPSMLSLHGGFPPVPEHEVAHHPAPSRTVSSRAEAQDLKKKTEEDILQLAQMPPSLDSSRSLAAQLAAYGDNHALEAEFAERERRMGGSDTASGSGSRFSEGISDEDGWYSARSGGSSSIGGPAEPRSFRRTAGKKASKPPSLLSIEAPGTTLPSINSIYDKRAAAYRDRMAQLTALPPNFPPSLSSRAGSTSRQSRRHGESPGESWLTAGPSHRKSTMSAEPEIDRHPNISSPIPASSLPAPPIPSSRIRKPSLPQPLRSVKSAVPSVSARSVSMSMSMSRTPSAPAPIADIVSTRYAGMSPPPHVPPPPRLEAGSPYISIFSNRYSGSPHDGDDSDDDETPSQNLTVVENDWGARLGPNEDLKRGRWGQFKGAIGQFRK